MSKYKNKTSFSNLYKRIEQETKWKSLKQEVTTIMKLQTIHNLLLDVINDNTKEVYFFLYNTLDDIITLYQKKHEERNC